MINVHAYIPAPAVAIKEARREDEEDAVVLEVLVVPPSGKG